MSKVYHYWLGLVLLLTTVNGWAQLFVPIRQNGVFRPVSEYSGEAELTVSGNYLYFVGRDASTGIELYRTDGTPENTRLVKDITPGPSSGDTAPTSLFDVNGTLYFFAGTGLYKTDGSEAGTVLLRNFSDIGNANLLYYNGLVIFKAPGGLWRTDGTPEGTFQLASRFTTSSSALKVFNGVLYFYASAGPTFQETNLFRTDGTLAGTSLVRQLPGTLQGWGVGVDGLYLTFYTGTFHPTPGQGSTWKSDGTAAGTVQLGPTTPATQPIYFNAFGDLYQRETTPGARTTRRQNQTTGVLELVTPTPNFDILVYESGVLYNGQIYGPATTPTTGLELSRLDGTPIRDLYPGAAWGTTGSKPAVVNGLLYFPGDDGSTGLELWQTDGSAGGTRLVGELLPGVRGSTPLELDRVSGALYFDTADGTLYRFNPDQTPPTTPVTPPTSTGGTLSLQTPAYDCTNGQLTLQTSGGDGSAVEYRAVGLRDWSASGSFSIPAWQRTGTTFTFEVRQSGQVASQPFTTSCDATPPATPNPPIASGSLDISAPDYNCTNGQLTVLTAGGSGSFIEYRIVGLRDWSSSNTFDVPAWQRTGTTFTLDARQDGQVTSRSFTSGCSSARLAVPETEGSLEVMLYPNPVGKQFSIGVTGAAGQAVQFEMTNLTGRSLLKQSCQVEIDRHTESLTMPADAAAGLYLLRVSVGKQTKTLKVVKQ